MITPSPNISPRVPYCNPILRPGMNVQPEQRDRTIRPAQFIVNWLCVLYLYIFPSELPLVTNQHCRCRYLYDHENEVDNDGENNGCNYWSGLIRCISPLTNTLFFLVIVFSSPSLDVILVSTVCLQYAKIKGSCLAYVCYRKCNKSEIGSGRWNSTVCGARAGQRYSEGWTGILMGAGLGQREYGPLYMVTVMVEL